MACSVIRGQKKSKENKNSDVANVAATADTESDASYTFCAAEENFDRKSDWYLDSGVFEHMANKNVNLINTKPLPKTPKNKSGNPNF